jgi:hypothetical protein
VTWSFGDLRRSALPDVADAVQKSNFVLDVKETDDLLDRVLETHWEVGQTESLTLHRSVGALLREGW